MTESLQKLFIYARKSTDDRDKQVQSIPDQVSELHAFARKNGIYIVEVLVEKQSAKKSGRKVFEAMLGRIAKGEAAGILAWHPDRLARNMTDGAKLVELVEQCDTILRFPTYTFENTPHGIFCLTLAFGQSKLYVDNLSENVRRGMRSKARRGVHPSRAPFGYINNRNTNTIDPDPEYAPIVVSLFEKYATGKFTFQCLRFKNRQGKLTPTSNVHWILNNPIYYGLVVWGGETYEGVHTPLITKKLFDKCQAVMEQRGREVRKHDSAQHPFRQLLVCAYCGCSITSSIQKGHTYYHCTKKKGKCSGKYVRSERIDEEVRSALQKVSLTPVMSEEIGGKLRELYETETRAGVSRTETLRRDMKHCEEYLDRLLDMSLSGDITRDEYIAKKNTLLDKKAEIREKMRSVSGDGDSWLEPALSVIEQATAIQNITASTDPADLSDFFKEIGLNRTLAGQTVRFTPRSAWKALYGAAACRTAHNSHTTDRECVPSCTVQSAHQDSNLGPSA